VFEKPEHVTLNASPTSVPALPGSSQRPCFVLMPSRCAVARIVSFTTPGVACKRSTWRITKTGASDP